MKFFEFGKSELPTVILLHGGGLSWWSLKEVINILEEQYHVVTPIIDGHGEDGLTTFISIEDSAAKVIKYIDAVYQGRVFAIGGLSIGAQIVTEILSQRIAISQFAIIESALIYPIWGTSFLTVPTYKLCYGLLKKKWFSKLQAKTLMVPDQLFEQYYEDSVKISKQSLINLTLSNGNYHLNKHIADTSAKVLILVGGKELGIMKKSAKTLHENIAGSSLEILPDMGHGEISLKYPSKYTKILIKLFKS